MRWALFGDPGLFQQKPWAFSGPTLGFSKNTLGSFLKKQEKRRFGCVISRCSDPIAHAGRNAGVLGSPRPSTTCMCALGQRCPGSMLTAGLTLRQAQNV